MDFRVNEDYRQFFKLSCPIISKNEVGKEIGICAAYMPDRKTCPKHGDTTEYQNPP